MPLTPIATDGDIPHDDAHHVRAYRCRHRPAPRVAGTLRRCLVALVQAVRRRRDLQVLASFDDRMLADIGLTRGDLRDAVAERLWHDPTAVLVMRARERRRALLSIRAASDRAVQAPPLAPEPARRVRGQAAQALHRCY